MNDGEGSGVAPTDALSIYDGVVPNRNPRENCYARSDPNVILDDNRRWRGRQFSLLHPMLVPVHDKRVMT